jgi:hypothetical protein
MRIKLSLYLSIFHESGGKVSHTLNLCTRRTRVFSFTCSLFLYLQGVSPSTCYMGPQNWSEHSDEKNRDSCREPNSDRSARQHELYWASDYAWHRIYIALT